MTPSLSISQDQIADLIATKLSADPTFRAALATALARQSFDQSDSTLRKATSEATASASVKLQEHLTTYSTSLKAEGEKTLRERFTAALRGPTTQLSDEWIKKEAKAALNELIRETFGRRAHHLANEIISTGASKIDLLFSQEGK